MLTLLITLCCFWLALPLLHIFVPLTVWILTRRIFWIGFFILTTAIIGLSIWQNQQEQETIRERQAWNAAHPSAYIRACRELGLDPNAKVTGPMATKLITKMEELE